MRKKLFLIAFCALMGINAFTQQTNSENQVLQDKIKQLESANEKLSNQIKSVERGFTLKLKAANDSIQKLKAAVIINNELIQSINQELGLKITSNETNANQKIQKLDNSLSKNTLYWIIAVLTIVLLLVVSFVFLRKQLFKNKHDLTDQISKTKSALEEEGIKLDTKLVELLETQMKLIKEEHQNNSKNDVIDHTLALKVADEIVRIEKNLNRIDGNEKDIKPIQKGLERIRDNFASSGYEMIQMLYKEYDDGMNIDVINFISDENIPSGKRIITRVIRPQVNYQGVLMQKAQVEVSQN
jgi:hypothetical protein